MNAGHFSPAGYGVRILSDDERQPIFNAPWPAVVATLVIIGGYFVQTLLPQNWLLANFAFSSAAFEQGRPGDWCAVLCVADKKLAVHFRIDFRLAAFAFEHQHAVVFEQHGGLLVNDFKAAMKNAVHRERCAERIEHTRHAVQR